MWKWKLRELVSDLLEVVLIVVGVLVVCVGLWCLDRFICGPLNV